MATVSATATFSNDEPKLAREAVSYTLSDALVAFDNVANEQSENFRVLRTHVMARHVEQGRRALVVCAPSLGVGCTFTAANLALSMSRIGVKTLLVDANMRNPSVDKLYQPSEPVVGLQQCLSSSGPNFGDFIQDDVLPNLSILFSGGKPPNAQELLAGNRFADLLNYCLRDYDLTILDTPPANTCSDANRVCSVAGYALIVAARDVTLLSDVKTLVRQLESDHARIVGTVMTGG